MIFFLREATTASIFFITDQQNMVSADISSDIYYTYARDDCMSHSWSLPCIHVQLSFVRLHASVNLDYLLTQLSTMFLCQMHISATLTLQWIVTKYLLTILQLTVTTHGHLPVRCISDELYSCSDPVCKSHFSVLQSLCLQLLLSTEESAHLHVHLPKTNVFFLVGILMHTLFVRLLHSGTRLV